MRDTVNIISCMKDCIILIDKRFKNGFNIHNIFYFYIN